MTISPFDPLRFPRYPLNNITPFTYRDGRTFLELIEGLKNYINEDYVAAVNALLDELNLATEESIVGIEATFNSQLATFNTTVDTLINETETEIANKILSVDSQVSAKLATVDTAITNMTTTVNDAVAAMNSNATVQIALVNSTMQGYMDDIDAQIAIINEKSGPVNLQYVTLTSDYVMNIDPLFPTTQPATYVFTQNATGGWRIIPGTDVVGNLDIDLAPNAITRVTVYPADGTWIAESSVNNDNAILTDVVRDSFNWRVRAGRQDLTTALTYEAFPIATRTASGRTIVAWASQTDHVTPNTAYLKWSDNDGDTWSNPIQLPAGMGPIGLASLGNRVAILYTTNAAPYRKMWVSFSTSSTVGTTWTPPLDIGASLYSTWQFPCSLSWFDNGTSDGLIIVNSYNDTGVWLTASTDGGATWYTHSNPSVLAWNAGPNESSVCLTAKGTMALFTRNDVTNIFMVQESLDWGLTWGVAKAIASNMSGMPKATLMPNNQILVVGRDEVDDVYDQSYAFIAVDGYTLNPLMIRHVANEFMMYGHVVNISNTKALLIGSHQVTSTHSIVWKRVLDLSANDPGEWFTYPVRWSQLNGTTLFIEDGTLTGRYTRIGKTVMGNIAWIKGASSNNGSEAYVFQTPTNPRAWKELHGYGMVRDTIPVTVYAVSTDGKMVLVNSAGARISNTVPGNLVAGNEMRIFFTYEEA